MVKEAAMAKDEFKVTLVYANTGEEVVVKLPGETTGAQLLARAYQELGKTPKPGDVFEIHDEVVNPATTLAHYAEEFGTKKKELVFEITNPTGGA
jgi:hypothetical protein